MSSVDLMSNGLNWSKPSRVSHVWETENIKPSESSAGWDMTGEPQLGSYEENMSWLQLLTQWWRGSRQGGRGGSWEDASMGWILGLIGKKLHILLWFFKWWSMDFYGPLGGSWVYSSKMRNSSILFHYKWMRDCQGMSMVITTSPPTNTTNFWYPYCPRMWVTILGA